MKLPRVGCCLPTTCTENDHPIPMAQKDPRQEEAVLVGCLPGVPSRTSALLHPDLSRAITGSNSPSKQVIACSFLVTLSCSLGSLLQEWSSLAALAALAP